MRLLLAVLTSITVLQAQSSPDSAELQDLINRARASAMRYDGHLPDFSCTKITVRWEDSSGSGKEWKKRDTLEEFVSFAGNGNTQTKLEKLNGVATNKSWAQLQGVRENKLLSGAIVPQEVFGPKAKTRFEWNRWETRAGRMTAVLRFDGIGENYPDGKTRYELQLTGDVYFDPLAGDVIRIEVSQQGPPGYPFKESGWEIDYAPVMLSGRELVLPVGGAVHGARSKVLFRNAIQYRGYRKYEADSSIRFDREEQ
jgi:hypothetical protein